MRRTRMALTVRRLRSVCRKRFGGVLTRGSHDPNGCACAHELESVCLGIPWTGDADETRSWDKTVLNDMDVPDELRTKWMIPVIAAYAGSMDWPIKRQKRVARKLVILTARRILPELPELSDEVRAQCRTASTLKAVGVVAEEVATADGGCTSARHVATAAKYAVSNGNSAALNAALAAAYVGNYGGRAGCRTVFVTACKLWLEAAD